MHAMVTARVPLEIRDQVNAKLRSIGSSPTELVNAAYDYVLATGELPDAQRGEAPYHAALTESCARKLQADFIVTHGGEVSVSRAVRRVAPDELFSVLEAEQGIVFDVIDF